MVKFGGSARPKQKSRKRNSHEPMTKNQMILTGVVAVVIAGVITIGALTEGDGGSDEASDESGNGASSTASTSEQTTSTASATASATESPQPTTAEAATLTVENNVDLAALLSTNEDYNANAAFAETYAGQTIEFDGNIAYQNAHDGYSTRYDMLVLTGDYSETEGAPGPNFQFRDVGVLDLNMTGTDVPNSVGQGDNLHIIATVGEFEQNSGLFLLDPVETTFR